MARDSNGNYTLAAGNPVVADDLIEASWANDTLDDLATAMQDSLSRSGKGGMLAGLEAFAGTISAPGYAWADELTTGWYRAASGDIRFAIGGVDQDTITAALRTILPPLSLTDKLTVAKQIDGAKGADIASAATINLTTATGNLVHVTGTTTITAVTLGSGMFRQVVFDGALTLTHHATNNNLPGGANITTAANDRALYWSDGTTVYCVSYQKASGLPTVDSAIQKSLGTTKGDTIAFTASATPARLAVGADGLLLGANSIATEGVQYRKPAGVWGAGKNILCSVANATASTAQFTATELVLRNSSGGSFLAESISVAPDLATSGANGLDTGAEANSTWYYLYVIYNPTTATTAGLWSLSSTSPTLPSGYTYYALASCGYNNGSGNIVSAYQRGNRYCWRGLQNVLNAGTASSSTAVSVATVVPPIADDFTVSIRQFGCTATGAGVYDITLVIEGQTGIASHQQACYFQSVGNSVAQHQPGGFVILQYLATNFYYYLTVASSATAPTATLDVTGFTLPVGGQ